VLDGYSWGVAPAAGVIAGATSASASSTLLKWGRLDGKISSANTESQYDVDTAQNLELRRHVQGEAASFMGTDRTTSFRSQKPERQLLSGRDTRKSALNEWPGCSVNESREDLGNV
jgi:hypothetical protein